MINRNNTVRTIITADDRTGPAFDGAQQRIAALARSSALVGVALFGAANVGAGVLTLLTRRGLESADAIAKNADQVGVSTQAWAAYEIAAQKANLSNQQLEVAFRTMNGRVAEAVRGNKQASEAFQALGLNAEALRQAGPEKAFETIVATLNEFPDAFERSRLAGDLFGQRNQAVLNLTAEAFDDAKRRAEGFGMAISRLDAAKIEQANDAISDFRRISQGIGISLASELSPYLTAAAEQINEMAIQSGGFRTQIAAALDVGVTGATKMAQGFVGANLVLQSLRLSAIEARLVLWSLARDAQNLQVKTLNTLNFFGLNDAAVEGAEYVLHQQELVLHQINKDREAALATGAAALTLYETLPEKAEEFRRAVERAAESAAQKVADRADARRHTHDIPVLVEQEQVAGPKNDLIEKEAALYNEQLMGRLDSLRQSLLSEEDAIRNSHHQRLTMIYEARSEGLISQQEFDALEIQLAQERNDALLEIENRRRDQDVANEQAIWQMKAQAAQDGASAMMNLTNALFTFAGQKNKALFNLNKIAGIAEATVSTYTGAAMALRSVPYPANLAAAASVIAAGLANVARIKSMQFGSGAAAGGFGGGTPDSPIVNQPLPQQSGPAQITVNVTGDIIDYQRWTEDTLAPVIRDAVGRNTDFGLEVKLA